MFGNSSELIMNNAQGFRNISRNFMNRSGILTEIFVIISVANFQFRGRSRITIHFRSASANISIFEIRTVVRNVFQVSRRFRVHWFSDPFHERLRGAPALRVFTSARSSYFELKIKRTHRGFGHACAKKKRLKSG